MGSQEKQMSGLRNYFVEKVEAPVVLFSVYGFL
jgi:hypothetical protein